MMRQSLVLITIDCLRADHAGWLGYPRSTTPIMDALARDSTVFENAQVAGAPTYYSFPAILASRYPLSLGRDVPGLPPQMPTLASVLRDAGYHTAGFNAGNPYLTPWFGYDQGFDTYDDFGLAEPQTFGALRETSKVSADAGVPLYRRLNRLVARMAQRLTIAREVYSEFDFRYSYRQEQKKINGGWDKARRYPDAAQVTQRVVAWLSTHVQSPFFLWVHYMDAHQPRYVSSQALAAIGARPLSDERQFFLNYTWLRPTFGSRYLDDLRSVYDASLHAVDEQVGVILRELKRLNVDDQIALAVISDHGEQFLEHGDLGHAPPKLFQELLHVPLIIHTPNMDSGHRVSIPFSVVDLAPTLLEMLGVSQPESFQGKSRWSNILDRQWYPEPVISEAVFNCTNPWDTHHRMGSRMVAVRYEQYKLILNFAEQCEAMFDLANDPGEMFPLGPDQARPFRRLLLSAARDHLQRMQVKQADPIRLRARMADLRRHLERQAMVQ